MQRSDIFLIVIIVVLIVGIGVGVTLYEQKQVKSHLTIANAYHTQMIALNPQLINSSSIYDMATVAKKAKPFATKELDELRAANTIFASQTQKDYIDSAIQVNTANSKEYDLIIAASKTTNNITIRGYAVDIGQLDKDRATASGKLDSLIAERPEEFGFTVVNF